VIRKRNVRKFLLARFPDRRDDRAPSPAACSPPGSSRAIIALPS
jgi:hypothetical protein